MTCLSITSQNNILFSTFILFILYTFVHRIPQGAIIKIRSTIDLYIMLSLPSYSLAVFRLAFCDDFDVTVALSFLVNCDSFLSVNKYLLTYWLDWKEICVLRQDVQETSKKS